MRVVSIGVRSLAGMLGALAISLCLTAVAVAKPPEGGPNAQGSIVPGRYIVVFEDSVSGPGAVADAQTARHNGKLGYVYRHALNGYSAKLSDAAVEALRRNPKVKYIEPVWREYQEAQTIPTGISRIFATENQLADIDGVDDVRIDVDVAVIDSRIDATHPDLDVVNRIDCVPSDLNEETKNCVADTGEVLGWHGTHVAGIIGAIDNGFGVVGAAPGARLWGVRIFGDNLEADTDWTIAAIDWVTDNASEIEVANMSFGAEGFNQAEDEAIANMANAGVVPVVAGGNQAENTAGRRPANSPDAITVSAVADYDGKPGGLKAPTCTNQGADDTAGWFSNWGKDIEIAAPGVCIYSTDPGGDYSNATWGTSFATPYVAAAAALQASQSNPSSKTDVEAIRENLIEGGSLDWNDTSGDGAPEPLLYLGDEPLTDPELATGGWSSTDGQGVEMTGAINARGLEAEYEFEYGATTGYGQSVPSDPAVLGAGAGYTTVSQAVGGLEPGQTYHYRLAATTSAGTIYGRDRTFTMPRIVHETPASQPTGSSDWLEDISCTSPSSCMATSGTFGVYRLVAGAWQYSELPLMEGTSSDVVRGVLCSSASSCVAVGHAWFNHAPPVEDEAVPLVERWNGSSWSIESVPRPYTGAPYSFFNDVSCISSTECMAVGAYENEAGVQVNYASWLKNGTWTNLSPPNGEKNTMGELEDVSCVSSDFCMAVGWYNTGSGSFPISMSWDGKSWSSHTPAVKSAASWSVSCTSKSFCMAVGGGLAAETWDGGKWTAKSAVNPGQGGVLRGVSCRSTAYCVAVGGYWDNSHMFALSESWNGTAWKVDSSPREAERWAWLLSVQCFPLSGCRSVGYSDDGHPAALFANRIDAITEPAGSVTPSQATLTGAINPGGVATTYQFEYGKTTSYGAAVPPSPASAGAGGHEIEVTQQISELEPETTYHYRLIGSNTNGDTLYGKDRTFRTAAPVHQFAASVGSAGSGPGQFDNPRGLDVDAEGNVWVADTNHHRVQKFNAKGEYVSQFGSFGTGNGQFNEPLDVAVSGSGNLLVTDGGNNRVQVFNSKGEFLSKFGSSGTADGQFTEPWGIDVAPDGTIWVADARYYRVQQFSAANAFIRKVTGFEGPRGVAVSPDGHVWVTENTTGRVHELSSTGEKLSQFGTKGSGVGELDEPQAIDVKPSGQLLVADRQNDDVQQFTPSGEYVGEFGAGQLNEPRGVAVAAAGAVFVSNSWKDKGELWQQAIPKVSTGSATGVSSAGASLAGSVNPRGVATSYRFEYGKTTAYGTSAPVPNASAGSGTVDVAVSQAIGGLTPKTLYHFRIVATNANGTIYGKDATFTTKASPAESLPAMPVTEPFNGDSASLARFSSEWSALGWAAGANPKGIDTTTGWRASDAYPTVNGAYWKTTVADSGQGVASVATMTAVPGSASRYFSLWLDASGSSASRSGYELRFTYQSGGPYTVTVSRWQAGSQTVLATKTNYTFAIDSSLALVDEGGTVSAWTNTGTGFGQLLSAADTTFSSGNAGLEAAGNAARLANFKAGSL